MVKEKDRDLFIDKASGIAIFLVVAAHIWFKETTEIEWYLFSKELVYKFHMPLFMCISGYLVFVSTYHRDFSTKKKYVSFQKKKIKKFLPIYLIAIFVANCLDIFVKNLPKEVVQKNIYNSFFIPASGTAVFIWYLYVLMGFYLIAPLLLKLKSTWLYLLLFWGFLLTNTSFSPIFSADLFAKYFFFFLLGGLIYLNRARFLSFIAKNGPWISIATIILLVLDGLFNLIIPYQLISVFMIFTVLFISTLNWPEILSKTFVIMGISSFAIYILNGPVMDVYYYIFKYFRIPIDNVFIFTAIIITIIVSILLRLIFNRIVPSKIYSL